MSNYFPKHYWNRERVDEHLELIVEILGERTVIELINRFFDVDAAAWFVEQIECDYELEGETYELDLDESGKYKYRYIPVR